MMIKLIKILGNDKEHEFTELVYDILPFQTLNDMYVIYNEDTNTTVGFIEYTINPNGYSLHIEYIHIFDEHRNKKYATRIVNDLNTKYEITGWSVGEAINFWKGIGAEFSEYVDTEEDINYFIESGECVEFVIS